MLVLDTSLTVKNLTCKSQVIMVSSIMISYFVLWDIKV